MSYYGYPNPQAYNANYQAYAAAYAASGGAQYDQYAAYNAAYRAMQMGQQSTPVPPPPPPTSQPSNTNGKSVSISQPAQRYDYSSTMNQPMQQQSGGYDQTSAAYQTGASSNMMQQQQHHNTGNNNRTPQQHKWNSMLAAAGGGMQNKKGNNSNQFHNQRRGGNMGGQGGHQRNPSGQPVQIFYCEVCKISCAGPQTYKEHLDGQKHKKREQASKLSTEQAAQAQTTNLNSTSPSSANANNNNNTNSNSNWKNQQQMQRGRNPQGFARNSVVIKCELCDVACTGKDAYTAHVRGMKHQKTLKLHQKLGKPIPPDALDILQAAANVTKTVTPTTTISAPVTYPQASVISAPPSINMNRPISANVTSNTAVTTTTTPVKQPLLTDQPQPLVSDPANVDMAPAALAPTGDSDYAMAGGQDQDEQINIEPIGREYIETRLEGKILSFYCKLCECQFNDPNAKDMHTKGRRHRLAYKKKVDPSLRVDMKMSGGNSGLVRNKMQRNMNTSRNINNQSPSTSPNSSANNQAGSGSIMPLMSATLPADGSALPPAQQTIQQLMSQPLKMANNGNQQQMGNNNGANYNWSFGGPNFQATRHGESFDDKHIIAKHNSIYPSQDEINAIQEIVNCTEKALKLVSDQIAEEDMLAGKKSTETTKNETSTNETTPAPSTAEKPPATTIPDQIEATKTDPTEKDSTSTTTPSTNEVVAAAASANQNGSANNQMFRALKGVMRVGLLAKGLLLKGDTDVQLIVLCADKPNKRLLERVYTILMQKIDIVSPQIKYSVILDKQAETIVIVKTTISDLQPLITCKVLLTSPAVRTSSEQLADQAAAAAAATPAGDKPADSLPLKSELTIIGNNNEDNDDLLDKQRCLDSLASLRHSKWFQARASNVPNCVVIIRILRDLCRRNPTWAPLSQWGLELLVERSLSSSNQALSPGEALRRVLECVSSGVLLPNGCGLFDPCEKDPTDVSDILKNQQREELTSSAQMALRLLAFKQIHKILGMESLSLNNAMNSQGVRTARKRQYPSNGNDSQIEEKKEKKETDTQPSTAAAITTDEIKMESNPV